MRFSFTDDQRALRDAVRDLLAKECPPEVVRAAWPDGTDTHGARKGEGARAEPDQVARVWSALAEMGVLGVAVPEDDGGLGLTALDWVLVAEETGYAALPRPFVETALVAAPLLAGEERWAEVVSRAVAGEATIAVRDLMGFVPFGAEAELVVDLLRRKDWEARVIDARLEEVDSIDPSRRLTVVRSFAAVGAAGTSDDAARAFDRGALGTAAQLLGLTRRMVDLTVGYVGERRQFGVPIGSFQAVKHHLADAALRLEFAGPAVHRAAWSLATAAPSADRDVSMAKALTSDAARRAGRTALQAHGAIGYTTEYDLHLYLKRAEVLARTWGDAAWHRRRVGAALGL